MKADIIDKVTRGMMATLNTDQISQLKTVLQATLCNYDISPKETSVVPVENNSYNYLRLYFEKLLQDGKSKGTVKLYGVILRPLLDYVRKNIQEYTDDDLINYMAVYRNTHDVTNRYLNNMRLVFNSFFRWLQRRRFIVSNPVDSIDPIKYRKEIKKPFNAEEMEKLRSSCDNERDLALLNFLYSSAVRVSELCALNIDDISFESNEVIVLGKGNKQREVYLSAQANFHLKRYIESRTDNNPALFVSLRKPNNRLTKAGVENMFKRLEKSSGVSDVHPHRFRRTSATDLLRMGMPIEQVQEFLGHAKIDTTRLYCTVNKDNVRYSHQKFMAA